MSISPPTRPAAGSAPPAAITSYPLLGVLGVLLGASIATCTGRLISVGLTDLRGALHLGVDEASWISTAFNAALMFVGPFSVYLGGLLGARRVLLACGVLFTLISVVLPLAPNLPVLLCPAGPRGTDRRHLLSAHLVLRPAQSSHEIRAARHCHVRHGYSHHDYFRHITGSLVQRSSLLALDLLEWRCVDSDHDSVGLLRHALATNATAQRGSSQT